MSYTKRKLMGLLTLGTATLGTVSSGATSAGWLDGVKNFFNPTTQTKETKKKSERIIDASRGYGAAINLANIICEDNKEGVIDLLAKELDIFSENENNTELDLKDLSEDQLLKKGNALLKIAYDLGIKDEEVEEILKTAEGYSELEGVNFKQNNSENTVNLYDDDSSNALAESFNKKKNKNNVNKENNIKKNKKTNTNINVFNLFLLSSNKLVSKLENGEKTFTLNISYHALKNEDNIAAVKNVLGNLKEKIFDSLKNAEGETLNKGISSIMQVIGEEKGGNYFKDIIGGLMKIKVIDKDSNEEVSFGDSTQFKKLIETIEKKEGNLKGKDLPKDTQKDKNKLDAVKEMIKFRDNKGVLFEVLDNLGYTRSAVGRFFDNKYVRVALGVGVAAGIAYVAGIPILSSLVTIKGVKFLVTLSFFKLAAGCLAATNLLDLRNQSFETWAWSNMKSAAKTTATIVNGVGSIIGKGMSLFEGYKW